MQVFDERRDRAPRHLSVCAQTKIAHAIVGQNMCDRHARSPLARLHRVRDVLRQVPLLVVAFARAPHYNRAELTSWTNGAVVVFPRTAARAAENRPSPAAQSLVHRDSARLFALERRERFHGVSSRVVGTVGEDALSVHRRDARRRRLPPRLARHVREVRRRAGATARCAIRPPLAKIQKLEERRRMADGPVRARETVTRAARDRRAWGARSVDTAIADARGACAISSPTARRGRRVNSG